MPATGRQECRPHLLETVSQRRMGVPEYYQVDQPPLPEPRRKECHKGDFGHVLVIAGSRRMMGAAALCSIAAARAGNAALEHERECAIEAQPDRGHRSAA